MRRHFVLGFCALAAVVVTPVTAQQTIGAPPSAAREAPVRTSVPKILPGTAESAFAIVQGNALDSIDHALPNSLVRLRDARYGRIVDSQLTDKLGIFSFRRVDPGSYIVELLGVDRSVVAASQLLSVSAGESVSTIVKLPFRLQLYKGLLGHTAQQAAVILSAAAASGVLASRVTGVDASAR